ncbi:hypothetical protein ACN469_11820 [Corallococcus terminator]
MSQRFARGPWGLAPPWPRLLSVLALGSLLLATPVGAQEEPDDEPAVAFVGLTLEGDSLRVRLQWSDGEGPFPDFAQLVSYDGQGEINDIQELFPQPGEVIEVELPGALKQPWETGWTQKLVVEDPWRGTPLNVQFYDLNLDCEDWSENCVLAVAPSLGTNEEVVHVRPEFDEALTYIEDRFENTEIDLLDAVSEAAPHLSGDALLYSQNVLRRLPYWGECFCTWTSRTTLAPSPAMVVDVSHSGGHVKGTHGAGAVGSLTARSGSAAGISHDIWGSNNIQLRPTCFRWLFYDDWRVSVRFPGGGREWYIPFPRPYLMPCRYSCPAVYEHAGRISGKAFVTVNGAADAYALVESFYLVDGNYALHNVAEYNASFDDSTTRYVWSNSGTTATVDSGMWAYASRSNLSSISAANTRNGLFAAIYAEPNMCWSGPFGPGAVWSYGTLQGSTQTESLRQSVQGFFAERGLDINP